jgi:hypothetical protein
MHHRVTFYWLLALAATVSVIVVGLRIAHPAARHVATSADISGLPDHGGWGRGGYTMMPGPSDIEGPVFTNAAAAMSENWAGYAVTGQPDSFTSVSASWSEPAVTCSNQGLDAFWVGLDGDGTQTVEQTGTEADCDQNTTSYQGWYELFPLAPVFYTNPVRPGDAMSASVASDGGGEFTLTLSDKTAGWTQSTRQNSPDAQLGSAEIIAEAPSDGESVLPLGDFGTAGFTGTTVNNDPLGTVSGLTAITMASNAGTLATPSALNDDTAFSVTWDSSGSAATSGGGQGAGSGGGAGGGAGGGSGSGGSGGAGAGGGQGGDSGQGGWVPWGQNGWGNWWGGY